MFLVVVFVVWFCLDYLPVSFMFLVVVFVVWFCLDYVYEPELTSTVISLPHTADIRNATNTVYQPELTSTVISLPHMADIKNATNTVYQPELTSTVISLPHMADIKNATNTVYQYIFMFIQSPNSSVPSTRNANSSFFLALTPSLRRPYIHAISFSTACPFIHDLFC